MTYHKGIRKSLARVNPSHSTAIAPPIKDPSLYRSLGTSNVSPKNGFPIVKGYSRVEKHSIFSIIRTGSQVKVLIGRFFRLFR